MNNGPEIHPPHYISCSIGSLHIRFPLKCGCQSDAATNADKNSLPKPNEASASPVNTEMVEKESLKFNDTIHFNVR